MTYKYISDSDFFYFDVLIAKPDDPIEIEGDEIRNPYRHVCLQGALKVINQIKPLCSPIFLS